MRRFDIAGVCLISIGAVIWTATRVFGSDVVPAKIVIQPVPTPPPPLSRLIIPGVHFVLGAGSTANGAGAAAVVANSAGNGAAATPNLIGTSYFADNPDASWALVSDGGGIQKIMKGARIAGSVVTSVGDGVLYLADGRELRPGTQPVQVPSIGNTTVPVEVAEPSPTPGVIIERGSVQTPSQAVTPFVMGTSAPPQALDPFALPTPQSMVPNVYPTPQGFR